MARYTGLFKVTASINGFHQLLSEILESCNFSIIYHAGDYLMAREVPGNVAFHQLVTVEVLVDKTTATEREVQMNIVIKNEELPLQVDNHCRQKFNQVSQAIVDAHQWKLIETAAS
ncbi:MAG: hypothetical protein HC866_12810 [Leptolyngbyaceae cyanobacterium RU_5_1]|nr:hypothetical protein [Leptolyngbyaceae cyanobacterium RU_5_1]